MCQVQASLTELSLSSALYVVTKPVLVNDVLMLKKQTKKATQRQLHFYLCFSQSDFQCFITFEY